MVLQEPHGNSVVVVRWMCPVVSIVSMVMMINRATVVTSRGESSEMVAVAVVAAVVVAIAVAVNRHLTGVMGCLLVRWVAENVASGCGDSGIVLTTNVVVIVGQWWSESSGDDDGGNDDGVTVVMVMCEGGAAVEVVAVVEVVVVVVEEKVPVGEGSRK